MLKRKAYNEMLAWKKSAHSQALLVAGARQIGKTFLIDEFARNEYPAHIKIDFLNDADAVVLFGSAKNADDLIERLSLRAGKAISPGQTLIFFDEVQEVPNIITLSKYLIQDGRFPVIMSGSMLGVELRHVQSLPVGYMHILDMFPLDFAEFCKALGVPDTLMRAIRECFVTKKSVESALHDEFVRLFRLYITIGGMPQAVQTYIDTKGDLGAVRDIQSDLLRLYREDIAKYAGKRALHVKAIFDAIPSQLNKENKRFELKTLGENSQFSRFANDFAWIVGANSALKTNNVTEPKYMLARTEEVNRFKLYQSDTGMLMRQYPPNASLDVIAGARAVNFGGVYENIVAQELTSAHIPLRYYHSNRRGEVDFLAETRQSGVVAIEVKSGKDYKKHTALNTLLGVSDYGVESAFVLSEANVSVKERAGKPVYYIPLYMLPFIVEDFASDASSVNDETLRKKLVVEPPDFSAWQ
ncbi:MAG: ATP-binding protein [Actinomycetaceae bacterium]|nr:ATP-binding protein [Actinomycetaceae bacterium]